MRRGWVPAAVFAAVTVALELVFRHTAHPVHLWHSLPAFDLVYGFLGCALIVLVSKAVGRAWLQRPEDCYGDDE